MKTGLSYIRILEQTHTCTLSFCRYADPPTCPIKSVLTSLNSASHPHPDFMEISPFLFSVYAHLPNIPVQTPRHTGGSLKVTCCNTCTEKQRIGWVDATGDLL